MLVIPHLGSFGGAVMRRRARERGAAPDNGAAVERWEAPAPCLIGGGTPQRSGRAPSVLVQGGSDNPPFGASRRSIPLHREGRKKGKRRARVHKNGAGGAMSEPIARRQEGYWEAREHPVTNSPAPAHRRSLRKCARACWRWCRSAVGRERRIRAR